MLPDFSIFDLVDAPVFVIGRGKDGRITYRYCNAASYALTGQSEDRMIGRTAVEVFGERLGRRIVARHEEALATGQRFNYEVTLPATLGEGVVRNSLMPLKGYPGFAVCTTRSGGSRLVHGRDLARNAREIEREASLARRALNLRGPMRKYGMLIDELKRDFTDLGNGKLALIDEIARLGEEAYDLVRQVLSYTRAATSRPAQPERVELAELCETLFATFDPDARHSLTAERTSVLVEPAVLWFVLHELLSEGLTEPGRHEFSVRCNQDRGGMLKVAVSCSVPMPPDIPPEACQFPEIESVLRSRGGQFTPDYGSGVRRCSFLLPGRVIRGDDGDVRPPSETTTAPPVGGTASVS